MGGGAGVGAQESLHVLAGGVVEAGGLGRDAILGHPELEVAHVSVVGGVEHAEVAGEAGEDDLARAEIVEQEFERGGVEAGVLGLEHEVVVRSGAQKIDDVGTGAVIAQAEVNLGVEVGLPAAEVVVHIDGGDAARGELLLQGGDAAGGRAGKVKKAAGFREVEGVDDIDEQQGGGGLFRDTAMRRRMGGEAFHAWDTSGGNEGTDVARWS